MTPISELKAYWIVLALYVAGIALSVLAYGYEGSFLLLNAWNAPFFDRLMPHLTHLGEGVILSSLVGLLMLRRDPGLTVSLALGMLMVLLFVSIGKHQLFDNWRRPWPVFHEQHVSFHHISQRIWTGNSFPSGHSAAAAACFGFWAAYLRQYGAVWPWLCGIAAAIAAYSRVYIGVHFPADTLAGVLLGAFIFWATMRWIVPRCRAYFDVLPARHRNLWQFALAIAGLSLLLISGVVLVQTYYLHD